MARQSPPTPTADVQLEELQARLNRAHVIVTDALIGCLDNRRMSDVLLDLLSALGDPK